MPRLSSATLRSLRILVPALLLIPLSTGQAAWRTQTMAGTGQPGHDGDGGPADRAQINNPFGVVRGPDGLIYFCEYDGHLIRRMDSQGRIHTVAGTYGEAGYAGDGGLATAAQLNRPHEVRFGPQGHLYIADMSNHVIRRVDKDTGIISTVAGTGKAGFGGDGGPAVEARLNKPHSIAFDGLGRLFICDIGNHRIRMVHLRSGKIRTFAGNGQRGHTRDGVKFARAPLNGPRTLDFDEQGNLWLALREGNQVWRLDLKQGTAHHVAGTGKAGFTGNGGPAREATLSGPKGLSVSRDGFVYLADTESHSIRRINRKEGTLELVCGTGKKGDGPDGDAAQCKMGRPHGVFVDRDGSVWVGDSLSHRVRRLVEQPD